MESGGEQDAGFGGVAAAAAERMAFLSDLEFLRFALDAAAQALQLLAMAVMIAVLARRGWFAPATPPALTSRGYLPSLVVAAGFLLSLPLHPLPGAGAFAVWGVVRSSAGSCAPGG